MIRTSFLLLASFLLARAFCSPLFPLQAQESRGSATSGGQPSRDDVVTLAQVEPGNNNVLQPRGTQHALILCGLSGDADHHKLFADTAIKLHEGLVRQLGFEDSRVRLLFGDEPIDSDLELIRESPRSTREELNKAVAEIRSQLQPDDHLWVIVVGHSHYDGKHSWLNLPGPDIHQVDFAKLFAGITAARQVFILTTPTSGYFIKPLSVKGRVIFTATETDWETNETEFPHELARLLTTPPSLKEFDVDGDGVASLYDLYVNVARNLAQSYVEREFLATEHSLLDDNGDGRGTEVQIDYLTEAQGGRANSRKPLKPAAITTSDGHLSRTIILRLKFSEAEEPVSALSPSTP